MSEKPPFVLLRKRRPPIYAETVEKAKQTHDQQRHNLGNAGVSAAVHGPDGYAEYCGPFSHSRWVRDDERRKRESLKEESAA